MTQVHWCPEYVYMGFETTAKSLWLAADLMLNPINGVEFVDPYDHLDDADVIEVAKSVHDEDYVDLAVGGVGLGLFAPSRDTDRLVQSILSSSAGMVSGARAVANGEQRVVSLSAGMHHASANEASGFCTFNGLAMAARELQEAGVEKILILDLDAHHGGGTEAILTERMSKVGHLDLAVDSFDGYQSTRDNTDMLLLPRGKMHRRNYLPTIEFMLAQWTRTHGAPEVVIYNAGMDPHQDCGTGGRRGITSADLRERERLVAAWTLSQGACLLAGLAGGYVGGKMTEKGLTALHRSTIEEIAWH